MRPVVVTRRPPLDGHLTKHWGIVAVRRYILYLDDEPPRLVGPPFLYTVAPDEPEVFEMTVYCEHHDIEWRLELDWICAGRTGTTVVDLGGYPFRTTAKPRRRRRGTRH